MNYENLLHHGFVSGLKQLRQGMTTLLPRTTTFVSINGTQTLPQAVAQLDATLALSTAAENAEHAWKMARHALLKALPVAHAHAQNLRDNLITLHGRGNPKLVSFGVRAKTRRKATPPESIIAAAKASLTRKKRNTLGTKQRAAIKPSGKPDYAIVTLGQGKPKVTLKT